jgi:hypothetical protein
MNSIPDTDGGNLFKIPSATGIKKEFPPCVSVNEADKHAAPVIDELGVGRL